MLCLVDFVCFEVWFGFGFGLGLKLVWVCVGARRLTFTVIWVGVVFGLRFVWALASDLVFMDLLFDYVYLGGLRFNFACFAFCFE